MKNNSLGITHFNKISISTIFKKQLSCKKKNEILNRIFIKKKRKNFRIYNSGDFKNILKDFNMCIHAIY